MRQCECGSYAINHNCHGRDGSDDHLCDVCYWRKRADISGVSIYIVERCGSGRFDMPELVDVYKSKESAKKFSDDKNNTNKSRFIYSVRVKRIKP